MLLKCPECGHRVSTQAKACPSCGGPAPKRLDNPASILAAIVGILMFVGIISMCQPPKPAPQQIPASVQDPPETIRHPVEPKFFVFPVKRANIRSGPATSYPVAGQVGQDDRLEILDRKDDWLWVQTGEVAGWIYAKLVGEEMSETEADSLAQARRDEQLLSRFFAKLHDFPEYAQYATSVKIDRSNEVTIVLVDAWHYLPQPIRLQAAQVWWQMWAAVCSPGDLDKARLKLVDQMGNKIGGSGWMGSSVKVD